MGVTNYTAIVHAAALGSELSVQRRQVTRMKKEAHKRMHPNDSHLNVSEDVKNLRRDTTEIVRKFDE